jgi:hypothetical protein
LIGSGCLLNQGQTDKPPDAQTKKEQQAKRNAPTNEERKPRRNTQAKEEPKPKLDVLVIEDPKAKPDSQAKEEPKAKPGAADAGDTSKQISKEEFERLYKLIRPLPGEYAWRDDIPWQTRFQAARAKAVAEDKPIFIMASANAFPLGRT